MIVYVEAVENLPPDSVEEPDFIRVDVTGYSQAEIDEIVQVVKELMEGTDYRIYMHYCYHDETPSKPCRIEPIK